MLQRGVRADYACSRMSGLVHPSPPYTSIFHHHRTPTWHGPPPPPPPPISPIPTPTRHRPPPRVLGITLRHLLPYAVQGEVLQGTHAALVQEAAGGREEVSGQMRGRGRSPRAPRPRLSRKLQGRVEGQQEEVSGQVRGRCRSSSAPRPRSSRKGSCRRGRGGGG